MLAGELTVFIRKPDGDVEALEIDSNATIGGLLQSIAEITGWDPIDIKVSFSGEEFSMLNDESALSDIGIGAEATIDVSYEGKEVVLKALGQPLYVSQRDEFERITPKIRLDKDRKITELVLEEHESKSVKEALSALNSGDFVQGLSQETVDKVKEALTEKDVLSAVIAHQSARFKDIDTLVRKHHGLKSQPHDVAEIAESKSEEIDNKLPEEEHLIEEIFKLANKRHASRRDKGRPKNLPCGEIISTIEELKEKGLASEVMDKLEGDATFIKYYGQQLSLDETTLNGETVHATTDFSHNGLKMISENLTVYCEKLACDSVFNDVLDGVDFTIENKDFDIEAFTDRLKYKNKCTVFPIISNNPAHIIGIALYKECLIVSDRSNFLEAYKLAPDLNTDELIPFIKRYRCDDPSVLINALKDGFGVDKVEPLFSIPKTQKHANCAFSSMNSLINGALLVNDYLKARHRPEEGEINKNSEQYKEYGNFRRNLIIQKLMCEYIQSDDKKAIIFSLLSDYFKTRVMNTIKKQGTCQLNTQQKKKDFDDIYRLKAIARFLMNEYPKTQEKSQEGDGVSAEEMRKKGEEYVQKIFSEAVIASEQAAASDSLRRELLTFTEASEEVLHELREKDQLQIPPSKKDDSPVAK